MSGSEYWRVRICVYCTLNTGGMSQIRWSKASKKIEAWNCFTIHGIPYLYYWDQDRDHKGYKEYNDCRDLMDRAQTKAATGKELIHNTQAEFFVNVAYIIVMHFCSGYSYFLFRVMLTCAFGSLASRHACFSILPFICPSFAALFFYVFMKGRPGAPARPRQPTTLARRSMCDPLFPTAPSATDRAWNVIYFNASSFSLLVLRSVEAAV